jgi:hypothetical protein
MLNEPLRSHMKQSRIRCVSVSSSIRIGTSTGFLVACSSSLDSELGKWYQSQSIIAIASDETEQNLRINMFCLFGRFDHDQITRRQLPKIGLSAAQRSSSARGRLPRSLRLSRSPGIHGCDPSRPRLSLVRRTRRFLEVVEVFHLGIVDYLSLTFPKD